MSHVSIKLVLKSNPKKKFILEKKKKKETWSGNSGYIWGNETVGDFSFSFSLSYTFLNTASQPCFCHVEVATLSPAVTPTYCASDSQGVHVIGPQDES